MSADPEQIYNWRRLDGRLTTSGQPSEAELQAIAGLGVGTVVNLALHSHEKALADEAKSCAALGMRYLHRPVEFANPTQADLDWFFAVMDDLGDAPVHVHCIANYRVSAFLYRYRIERLGWDKAKARADMDAIWTPEGVWAAFVGA
jgi:uncharacterized protein (TIGR01244 family)